MSSAVSIWIKRRIANTGDFFRNFLLETSQLTYFCMRFFKEVVKPPYEFKEFAKQSKMVGNKSLLLIASTAMILGLVLTIQTRPALVQFGAQSWLPAMVAISIVREIGPAVTALIYAGKAGSGIGAELASMKITEQIDAMEVSGINPFKYVVVTRILSSTLMLPILVVFADTVALCGSYFAVNLKDNISLRLFFFQVFNQLQFSDIFPAFIKTFFFGFTIGLVSCYVGYNAGKGTESVGKAANSAVVFGSFLVFIIDLIAVQVTSLLT
jgi:phospholipid/cholesterol/gamma-HCH transport system permease protein